MAVLWGRSAQEPGRFGCLARNRLKASTRKWHRFQACSGQFADNSLAGILLPPGFGEAVIHDNVEVTKSPRITKQQSARSKGRGNCRSKTPLELQSGQ